MAPPVKCLCQNCSARLEFDASDAGKTITCPTCNLDTTLYIPAVTTQKEELPPFKFPSAPKKRRPSVLGPVLIFIAGALLTLFGFGVLFLIYAFSAASTGPIADTTLIWAAVHYCTGLLLMALGVLIEAVQIVSKNQ